MHGRAGRVMAADAESFPSAPEHVRGLFEAGVPVVGFARAAS